MCPRHETRGSVEIDELPPGAVLDPETGSVLCWCNRIHPTPARAWECGHERIPIVPGYTEGRPRTVAEGNDCFEGIKWAYPIGPR